MKLQQLHACNPFSFGVAKGNDDNYVINIVLREPAPYGVPSSIDGVPIVSMVLGEKNEPAS